MSTENCMFCKTRFLAAEKTLTSEEVDELQRKMMYSHYNIGYKIFEQGTVASHVYFLKEGIVKLIKTVHYKDKIINIINSPNYIGI